MKTGFHLPLINDDGWDFSCVAHQHKTEDLIEKININKNDLNISYRVTHPPEPFVVD